MTPVEIDTVLAANWAEQQRVALSLEESKRWLAKHGEPFYAPTQYADRIAALTEKLDDLRHDAAPYEAVYAARPWRRYFLVTNSNGHVHRGMNCSTCFPTTEYSWLIDLADCDEAKMVEEFGEKACTVCFPDAPALPAFHAPGRRDREAIAAREAEKAAKQAAKDAKSIVDVDGRPLRSEYGVIKTKVAARNELSGALKNIAWYGPHPTDFPGIARRMAAALRANAPEIDVDKVIANALKAAKKEGARNVHAAEAVAKTL
jgi:hypothetical protein